MRRLAILMAAGSLVALCGAAGAFAAVDPLVPASGLTPFAPACNGAPQTGTEYRNTEPEPYIDVNPINTDNLIGVYQQDRFSDGGANGQGTSVSFTGGASWTRLGVGQLPPFNRCSGGSGVTGDYERSTDPWVSFGPDGDAYQITLSFNQVRDLTNAILVSESQNGGLTWGPITVIRRDTDPNVFNDKESITADYTDARFVYAIWDRLVFPRERAGGRSFEHAAAFRGPTWFARTTDGGASWEPARPILDPGPNDQTIGNQIVVMPDGDLVNVFNLIHNDNRQKRRGHKVAVMLSGDKGATWTDPIVVDRLGTVEVSDPRDGAPVRTGDIIPEVSSDERGVSDAKCATGDCVYTVWQDARFTGFARDQIAFSRSSDGGRTWSAPVRINRVSSTQAFTPMIKVDDEGNIGVTYYDFRNDTTASPTLDTDAWFIRSTDGGQTWTEERLTPAPFDMRTAPFAIGYFTGDYEGLTAFDDVFKPFSTLTNPPPNDSCPNVTAPNCGRPSGSVDTLNRTDVYSTTVHAPFTGPTYSAAPAPAAAAAKVAGGKPRRR